jgi:hypothetical protein
MIVGLNLPDGFVAGLMEAKLFDDYVKQYGLRKVMSHEQIENAKKSHEPLKAIIELIPGGYC